jgi:glycosyltransferase involved in cell wall biosynthesis
MRVLIVTNLYPSAESPANGVFIEQQLRGLSARMDLEILFVDRRRYGPAIYYRLGAMLENKLASFPADLIHVMYGGVMAQQTLRHPNLPPAIITFHGSDLLGENFSGWWRKLASSYGIWCSRRAARRAHGLIVVARHLLKPLGNAVRQMQVRVIPCGIDLDRFQPMDQNRCRQQLGWAESDFHVLFATSSNDPVKRPELARATVARLNELNLGRAQLHVLRHVPNQEVPIWLNAADALLLTSRQEGSPTIVKEALACGLPVVSVPVGDVPERLAGIEGCYVTDADPDALAAKLELIREGRPRPKCREKLEGLSCRSIAARIEEFYDEVLRTGRRGGSRKMVPARGGAV